MPLTRFLDPRFALIARLIDDPTETDGMRETARRHAEAVAAECGYSFDQALAASGFDLEVADWATTNADDEQLRNFCEAGFQGTDEPDAADEGVLSQVVTKPHESATENDCLSDRKNCELKAVEGDEQSDAASGQIETALRADPSRSDRDVAREVNASPTTVGRIRSTLGLGATVRTVTRRGKPYTMAVAGPQEAE